ncbi:MAG: hypothetical protein AAFX01_06255 [Cyanobacteria bacterium J06638_28]
MAGFFFLMAFAIIMPILMVIFGRRWAQNHYADQSARVRTVGQALGLSDRVSKSALSKILREIPGFSLGRSHSILYALQGERHGVAITIFELSSLASGSNSRSNSGVYLLMQSSSLDAPTFTLEPADMHIGSFGLRFEAVPQFAKRFSLRGTGDNEAALRETFTPSVLTFLLEFAKRFRLWGYGPYLLYGASINRFNQVTHADKLQALIDDGLAILPQFAAIAESQTATPTTRSPGAWLTQARAAQAQSAPKVTRRSSQSRPTNQRETAIAGRIADIVAGGGTYKPDAKGMGASAYDFRQGQFSHEVPDTDPREAIMRGGQVGTMRRACSREQFVKVVQPNASLFNAVLSRGNGDTDSVEQAMANQILEAVRDRGACQLKTERYTVQLAAVNDRYLYQCNLPTSRYNEVELRRSFNHADAVQ